ncbi:hypothetical protein B9Z55_022128 [Caenorhabditis nigoni]|uniref:Integrase catalytic domain-containing protein n=1 Tax=Caenorhabditis nigoni TaxID=1611254 RepID=A0A2G5TVI2_9PELO|nr:hypothetical protein B9Z55_022128 [Caenorhabditis nigoni]
MSIKGIVITSSIHFSKGKKLVTINDILPCRSAKLFVRDWEFSAVHSNNNMSKSVLNEFKKQMLLECEEAQQVLDNAKKVLQEEEESPDLMKAIGGQLVAKLAELNGIETKIYEFLDSRVQYSATEDERKLHFNEIKSHVEKKGFLSQLKEDFNKLLIQTGHQKPSEEASVNDQCDDQRQGHFVGDTGNGGRITRSISKQRGARGDGPSVAGASKPAAPTMVPAKKLFESPADEANKSVIIEEPSMREVLQRIETLEVGFATIQADINEDRAVYRENSEFIVSSLQKLTNQAGMSSTMRQVQEVPRQQWNGALSQRFLCNGFDQTTGRPVMGQLPEEAQPRRYSARDREMEASKLVAIGSIVKPFDGDAANYPMFMSNFDHFVHDDDSIPKKVKQAILISKLEGQAAREMQSAELSDRNYDILRENLHRQYGQNKYQRDILITKLKAVNFDNLSIKETESVLNDFCNIANKLQCFDININDKYFLRDFLEVLPKTIRNKIVRRYYQGNCTFAELSRAAYDLLLEKLTIQSFDKKKETAKPDEILINVVNERRDGKKFDEQRKSFAGRRTQKFTPPAKMIPCAYCDSQDHAAVQCTLPVDEKREKATQKGLCMNCLSDKHLIKSCKSKFNCFHCKARHYSGHCNNTNVSTAKINNFALTYDLSEDEDLEEQLFHFSSQDPGSSVKAGHQVTQSISLANESIPNPTSGAGPSELNPTLKIPNRMCDSYYGQTWLDSFVPIENPATSSGRVPTHLDLGVPEDRDEEPIKINISRLTDAQAQLPFIQLTTPKGEKLIALADSGAQSSVISTKAAERFGLPVIGKKKMAFSGFVADTQPEWCPYYKLEILDRNGKAWATAMPSFHRMSTTFRAPDFSEEDNQYLTEKKLNVDEVVGLHSFDGQPVDVILGNNVLNKIKKLEKVITHDLPSGRTIDELLIGFINHPPPVDGAFVPASQAVNINVVGEMEHISIHTIDTEDYDANPHEAKLPNYVSNAKLSKMLEQNTSLEAVGIENPTMIQSKEDLDNDLIEQFKKSAMRDENNKIYVQFPFNGRQNHLGQNYPIAVKRLESMCRTKLKSSKAKSQFHDIIKEQVESGIIEEVTPQMEADGPSSYLPSSVVIREESNYTKLRIVHDASAHMKGELSLNECLYPGPALLNKIVGILMRARLGKYLMASDLEKAFHQVRLQKQFRNYVKFLWLRDPELGPAPGNIVEYRFTRLPFGVACSPFLLAVTILLYLDIFPTNINDRIKRNLYVDNVLFVSNSINELMKIYLEAKQIFGKMHMNLREFLVNSDTVMEKIAEKDRAPSRTNKLLGLVWDSTKDTISIKVATPPEDVPTKRELFAFLAKNYDPCGLITPLVVKLKKLASDVCYENVEWNEKIPDKLIPDWIEAKSMFDGSRYEIPRQIVSSYDFKSTEIVMFSDASKFHYAAAGYLRYQFDGKEAETKLIMSKSRVKPCRSGPEFTIPKMELISLELATNAAVTLAKELDAKPFRVTFFSDSTCVLYWVLSKATNMPGMKWIANRIKAILQNIDVLEKVYKLQVDLRHVRTDQNPADIATRGDTLSSLLSNPLWNEGPSYLKLDDKHWPPIFNESFEDPTEFRKIAIKLGIIQEESEEQRAERIRINSIDVCTGYQSIVPYEKTNSSVVLISRMNKVCQAVYKLVQKRNARYPEKKIIFQGNNMKEYQAACEDQNEVSKREVVKRLIIRDHYRDAKHRLGLTVPVKCKPVVKDEGLKRLETRFAEAKDPRFTKDMKYPIIIISKHPLARLLVLESHWKLNHQGTQDVVADVQRSYWMDEVNSIAKQVRQRCFTCQKQHAKPYLYPFTRNLPQSRTDLVGPYKYVGLDYLGPLKYQLTEDPSKTGKVWVLLITCIVTRAIHLEIVTNNQTSGFINALRRFIGRRGAPVSILSDNATQFKLGYSIINADLKTLINKSATLTCFMAQHEIKIKHITPLSPWQGGIYERLVALVKNMINKVLGQTILPFLELETLLVEVEGILNSRPITPNKKDASDCPALRPIDFLYPNAMLALPEKTDSVFDVIRQGDSERLARQLLEETGRIKEQLWDQFSTSYFQALKDFIPKKSAHSRLQPKPGHVVLIQTKTLPRYKWPLGVIVDVVRSKDDKAQTVLVKTKDYTLEKPVNQLIPLEDPGDDEEKDNSESTPPDQDPVAPQKIVPTPQSRGRPKGSKNKKKSGISIQKPSPKEPEPPLEQQPKRGRGRPPKNSLPQPSTTTKPSTTAKPSTTTKPSTATVPEDARSRPYLPRQVKLNAFGTESSSEESARQAFQMKGTTPFPLETGFFRPPQCRAPKGTTGCISLPESLCDSSEAADSMRL